MFITFICDPFPSPRFSSGLTESFNRGIAFYSPDDVMSNEPAQWRMKTTRDKSYSQAPSHPGRPLFSLIQVVRTI
ncbi:hypothetical protein BS47DRAFT_458511 [Hydnum rufescens UP504]|uniref:Uncharacterized protein n=1 Tax=Hydnum rufescens UP504 TaxID=1448309 RepID=A0A9P6DQ03_9AGAM|nr:hypothetical protein BS47DRAFT_458511 [Hydnum rufescens UP504]